MAVPNATDSLFDLTNTSNQNDIFGFIQAVNDLTGQVFMIGVLLVSFVILFMAFIKYGTEDALLASGFITTIMTILFLALNLVPKWIAIMIMMSYAAFWAYRMIRG